FPYDESRVREIFGRITEHVRSGASADLVAYLEELSRQQHDKKGDTQITADQRCCAKCGETTILGGFARLARDYSWVDVPELAFRLTWQPNEDVAPAAGRDQWKPPTYE